MGVIWKPTGAEISYRESILNCYIINFHEISYHDVFYLLVYDFWLQSYDKNKIVTYFWLTLYIYIRDAKKADPAVGAEPRFKPGLL